MGSIIVGETGFRYVNFITSENGKTIFYTTPYPYFNKIIYFGIDSNGNPIFKDLNSNNEYIYQKENLNNIYSYESIPGLIQVDGDIYQNKKYLISIAKASIKADIFDYDNYEREIKTVLLENMQTDIYLGNMIQLMDNYYMVGQIKRVNTDFSFCIVKFNLYFNENGILSCRREISELYPSFDSKITYCYLSNQNNNIIK